jgi:hypothetical protein
LILNGPSVLGLPTQHLKCPICSLLFGSSVLRLARLSDEFQRRFHKEDGGARRAREAGRKEGICADCTSCFLLSECEAGHHFKLSPSSNSPHRNAIHCAEEHASPGIHLPKSRGP